MLMLNKRDPRPLYEQVQDSLRTLIFNGALAPDEKLPSVRELARQLAINPNTIQRAYRELEAQGLIYTVPGKGAFVEAGDAAAAMRRRELMDALRNTARELHALDVSRADALQAVKDAYECDMPAGDRTADAE